jgi:hypothetical protein
VHIAVDTLGHLLALAVTPANQQDREQVGQLTQAVQAEVEEPVRKWPSWIKVTPEKSRWKPPLNKVSS